VAAAAVDPSVAEAHTLAWQHLEDLLATLLARHHGRTDPAASDRDVAALLLAGLDGLAVAAVSEAYRLPPTRVQQLAERLVDQALSSS
jgi:hypothetical protein